ncbi:hypothetical protein KUTeg_024931 [Tegillarca granosa]|uniref:Receptor ligand binding region domain-containing protein n=1 Tax=Tegillarca granosa TaxID=220873 RepID=A0ABQ9DZQ7_TEGGR|nr:hypothetical protein KUTeg_024931 [Tegillarca granosa]
MYVYIVVALARLEHNQTHIVFGPYDDAIAMVTEKLRIPYISMTAFSKENLNSTFQLIPSLSGFSEAILDMMKLYIWERVSLFYDDEKVIINFTMSQLQQVNTN